MTNYEEYCPHPRKGLLKNKLVRTFGLILVVVGSILLSILIIMHNCASPLPSQNKNRIFDKEGFPQVDWSYWHSINPDVVGWITIPGTAINYPIVQASTDNPDYYLNHDVYKHYNIYGVPFVDADCADEGLNSKNTVVLGHHMNDGSMFAVLSEFSNREIASSHERILLQTPDWKQIQHVSLVKIINGDRERKITSFPSSESFETWYQKESENAIVKLQNQIPERVTTYCTCSYNFYKNERTLVMACATDQHTDQTIIA